MAHTGPPNVPKVFPRMLPCSGGGSWIPEVSTAVDGVSAIVEALLRQRRYLLLSAESPASKLQEELLSLMLQLTAQVSRCSPGRCKALWGLEQFTTFLVEVRPECEEEPSSDVAATHCVNVTQPAAPLSSQPGSGLVSSRRLLRASVHARRYMSHSSWLFALLSSGARPAQTIAMLTACALNEALFLTRRKHLHHRLRQATVGSTGPSLASAHAAPGTAARLDDCQLCHGATRGNLAAAATVDDS